MNGLTDTAMLDKTNNKCYSIGIGITTHNRNPLVRQTVAKIQQLTPEAKIVVVDDASLQPVKINNVLVYRFDKNVGIARAKNKCLELLSDYDHIFLFDDDAYPLVPEWWLPYVNNPEPHLMYCFDKWSNGLAVGDDFVVYEDENTVVHRHGRGCMIYVERKVLDVVGGMDVRFGKAMDEHIDWTNRIYNAGLTTFKYMDVHNSDQLIYSMDEHKEVISSIEGIHRRALGHENKQLLKKKQGSSEFAPYGKDVVIACYFAGVPDVQRDNHTWSPDLRAIDRLKQSVESKGYEFILIHNCFDLPNRVTTERSPYFERWLKEWQYLRQHPEINNVFVVDATDVDMLNDPFKHMKPDTLYVGDEPGQTLESEWLVKNHPNHRQFFLDNRNKDLLNCGVVGGSRAIVMELLQDIYRYGFNQIEEQTEMGIFNYLMYSKYVDRINFGRHVTTLFKRYEPSSSAWWRHK